MGFKPHSASKAIFGGPSAPSNPRPDNSGTSGTQESKAVRFVLPITKRTKPHRVKSTIGKKFTPTTLSSDTSQSCQSITFMGCYKPFSFEELRLADYKKLNKWKSSSKADSGLSTASAASQPENKDSATSLPLRPILTASAKTDNPTLIASDEATKVGKRQPTTVWSSGLSDTKDTNSSRSFFGLPSGIKTSNMSGSSFVFSSVPAAKTEPLFNFAAAANTTANDKQFNWFAPSVPLKQDSNDRSLFSSLPKIIIPADFTFSKVSGKVINTTSSKIANELSVDQRTETNKKLSLDTKPSQGTVDVSNVGKTPTTASLFASAAFKFNSNPPLFPSASKPKMSASDTTMAERQRYLQLHHTQDAKISGADEQLRTTPLISLKVKETSGARLKTSMFPQYAFLGCRIPESCSLDDIITTPKPIEMQSISGASTVGSGKSYTLSAMIESCLYPSAEIRKLPKPLAGVVFHNSTVSMHNICEAAHLVSLGVKVNVLVSRSNFHSLSTIYKSAVGDKHEKFLNIQPLVLQSYHLTAERMHRLMAFQEGETTIPLYMEVIMRILREMAITGAPFSYSTFKANLDNEGLQPGQKVMMEMRLNLLESFLDPSCVKGTNRSSRRTDDLFTTSPGTLTIVDLSDPFLDSSTTCTLFSILLDIFLASRPASGLLVCLDEAHKFMKNTPAAETLTENLLTVIREQRHNACRIVIATQEPTISPKLLDLCSMTFKEGAAALFEKIIELDVGESLLFAPSAVFEEQEGKVVKLGVPCFKSKTRKRLGVDGGQSVLAVRE
ncbi:hypothetical protein M436DRAFT_71698 [Aureobasidium namibiae CBS 147.97]|uniref:P-loop containing nucleoside triphosphate hydrolase protein n=1 Tax=Aureobasidium namibiae CBS 147.97 TaxID=1043004 RepID=A0A074WMB0_9PEZI|nr:uncharacterized protein M436DRAFT_71698 [Aureobasidium namibiae CBS 147.97]KEQ74245.1 hypothetical protein M436DRAFT_71698 [Aureobasidium namibiae CBS 147.97]